MILDINSIPAFGGRPRQTPYQDISSYSQNLLFYLYAYLDKLKIMDNCLDSYGNGKEKNEAKYILKTVIERNISVDIVSLNDYNSKICGIFYCYVSWIMKLVGRLCECIFMTNCMINDDANRISINFALFKDPFNLYNIAYDKYIPYSTSYKNVVVPDLATGTYLIYDTPQFNPNDTQKDIGWCEKDNLMNQLILESETGMMDVAKLQIKASVDYNNLDLTKYEFTPVVYFSMSNDFCKLKNKYKKQPIIDARDISPRMQEEAEYAFKILGSYASGIIDHINISDTDLRNNELLRLVLNTPISSLRRIQPFIDMDEIGKKAQYFSRPIVVSY